MNDDTVVPIEAVRAFRNYAIRKLGIEIHKDLEPLIGGRFIKRMQHFKEPLHRYLSRVYGEEGGGEIIGFLDFVRPRPAPFFARRQDHDELRAQVRAWLAAGARRLHLWSAGCGSGEEPYGMALTVTDAIESVGLKVGDVDFSILSTDISPRVLDGGRLGLFESAQLRYVPEAVRKRHFFRAYGGTAISDAIRSRVEHRCLNLATVPYPMKGDFAAIFCHEALAPMVPAVRARAIQAARDLLLPGGLFCSGFDQDVLEAAATQQAPQPANKQLGPCEC
jgi:chemotaxis protein methyltransferase CheR